MAAWSRNEIIGLVGIGVAIFGAVATVVVPELRKASGLSPEDRVESQRLIEPMPASERSEPTKPLVVPVAVVPVIRSVTATSTHVPMGKVRYEASRLIDGNTNTAWVEGAAGPGIGETVTIQLSQRAQVNRLWILNGYAKSSKAFSSNNRISAIHVVHELGGQYYTLADSPNRQYLQLSAPVKTNWLTLTVESVYFAPDSLDTAITEIGVE